MKDIHSHILYGIDDGSYDLEESIHIIENAIENGYTDLLLTPHYRACQGYTCNNQKKLKIFRKLEQEVKKRNLPISLYLGNEVSLDEDLIYYLKTRQIMSMNKSKYLLLELPFEKKVKDIKEIFKELKQLGYTPIIAHPERYDKYKHLSEFQDWIHEGVLLQGNIGSLYGKYGKVAQRRLEDLLKHHMIHFIGSDIHHESQTSYARIEDVVQKLEELTGSKEMPLELVDKNIEKVIQNENVEAYPMHTKKARIKIFRSISS